MKLEPKTTINTYYEIISPANTYGLEGKYSTREEALEAINKSYKRCLENGYDRRNERWFIVRTQYRKSFDGYCEFLCETTDRFLDCRTTFDHETKQYIIEQENDNAQETL